jgi:TolB-like protein/DNA-binding CsgD family transcriptional regulator
LVLKLKCVIIGASIERADLVQKSVASNRKRASPISLGLTKRQLKVLALVMQGKSNKAICRVLDLAETTVKYHVTIILKALDVSNRTEAVLAVGKLGWNFPTTAADKGDETDIKCATPNPSKLSQLKLALPDKPSIVVLPFANLSGDSGQDYFADGLVEDITVSLGRIPWLFVIGSGSAFAFKSRTVDATVVGADLGVRYVLRGSVRKSGHRVRIIVELTDAANGRQVWADRLDSRLVDIFDIQDQVVDHVAAMIAPTMRRAEIERARRKPTENLTAYDLFLQALPQCRPGSVEVQEALRLLYRAIDLDPSYGAPYGLAALCHRMQLMFSRKLPSDSRVDEALRLAHVAAEMGKSDSEALWMAGEVMVMLAGEFERGQALIEQSIALNPNSASAWNALGIVRAHVGDPETALEHFSRARRLDPVCSLHHNYWVGTSLAHFIAGRYQKSSDAADVVLNERTNYPRVLSLKAASCAQIDRIDEGRACVDRLLVVNPQATVATFKAICNAPFRRNPRALKKYLDGLRRCGLPEGVAPH